MIKYLEKSARTEDAAIAEALNELGLDRDDVSVEILERAKSGFLGIGASPARIRVSYECPDEEPVKAPAPAPVKSEPKPRAEKKPAPEKKSAAEKKPAAAPAPAARPADPDEPAVYGEIRAFLSGLLERMGVNADIEIGPRENGGVNVNLTGASMGAIIGRRGETLDAIQHLTNYVVNKTNDKHLHISVDAEAYRAKREESLARLAEKMAEKAIKYKRSMALEPMNSYERHVIHTALQNYEGVTTSSTGVEPNRRVVVSYVKPDKPDNKPKSREWA
ncbi:MAG: RNA-binding cell elongation regulator Jag/EloR [Eubacteriales bacterium]|nr:RNA-binding cell elongation regulator Jag/EloR [Eubacteriales bacterium]